MGFLGKDFLGKDFFGSYTLERRRSICAGTVCVIGFFKITINVILNFRQQISIHSNSHCGTFL